MSRPLPHSIRSTLGFVIPLLGSDRDGEALGAARAIGRKLGAAGLDFHDLAAVVVGTTPFVVNLSSSSSSSAEPRPRSRRAEMWKPPVYVEFGEMERSTLLARLAAAVDHPLIAGWERHEIQALAARITRGERQPTRRMIERAEAIIAELRGEAA